MDSQRLFPREIIEVMFCGVGVRVGVVEREESISWGREERKAPRQLIVLGTWKFSLGIDKELPEDIWRRD